MNRLLITPTLFLTALFDFVRADVEAASNGNQFVGSDLYTGAVVLLVVFLMLVLGDGLPCTRSAYNMFVADDSLSFEPVYGPLKPKVHLSE